MQPIYKGGAELLAEMQQTTVAPGSVAIWHLGQVCVAIKGPHDAGLIAVDPYLTHAIEEADPGTEFVREIPPPLRPEELAGASGILVSHFHADHLDVHTLQPLAASSPRTCIAAPASHVSLLANAGVDAHQILPAKDGERFTLGGFEIEPVAEPHTRYEQDAEGNHFYLGYLITIGNVRIYHAGDCVPDPRVLERVRAFHPDIAFLPINGEDFARTSRGIVGNMNGREAADCAAAVGADLLIPTHYDMFPNNRENPAFFVDYLFQTYRAQKFHMMVPGERFIYVK